MKTLRRIAAVILLGCSSVAAHANSGETAAPEQPQQQKIPFKREPAVSGDGSRFMVGVGFCALLVAGAWFLVRRREAVPGLKGPMSHDLRMVTSRRISARTALHVIEFGTTRYLLAENQQELLCLASVPCDAAARKDSN